MSMRSLRFRGVLLVLAWSVLITAAATAQNWYAAGGFGPIASTGGRLGSSTTMGAIGYQANGGPGIRIAGADQLSRFWFTGDLTWQFADRGHQVIPYALLGGGVALSWSDSPGALDLGGGVLFQMGRRVCAFAEARMATLLGSPSTDATGTFIPITLGLRVSP